MKRFVTIHGHFYQPPRENPWLDRVEPEASAHPYHDWNERIDAECYRPNAQARILDERNRIRHIVNNYERISFNFGATLLRWLERHDVTTYRALLDADRRSSAAHAGHGGALAQAYGHAILPLCNERDRETQVRWGLRDFAWRFGRDAEGMWLPETAVDLASLDTLARHGLRFTVLAPGQAQAVRAEGGNSWTPLPKSGIDTRKPYRVRLPSGREIAVFFYDASISTSVAFERLLGNGAKFAERLLAGFDGDAPQLVHIATDGETYGHHHAHGDMALAYALDALEHDPSVTLTNYGEYLELHPARDEVSIRERTAWSCAHGLGRWSTDCGCGSESHPGWNQAWRAPLREALDWLRDTLASRYEEMGSRLLRDPWEARHEAIDLVLDRSAEVRSVFLERHATRIATPKDRSLALKLLEMQRQALLMYASCGWFFDELSRIETVQVMRYAGRAAELADECFEDDIKGPFLERLAQARSNLAAQGDGKKVFDVHVAPARVDLARLGADLAADLLTDDRLSDDPVVDARCLDLRIRDDGLARLALGKLSLSSRITEEGAELVFAFLLEENGRLLGGVRYYAGEEDYREWAARLEEVSAASGELEVLRERLSAGLPRIYTLDDLRPDTRRRLLTRFVSAMHGGEPDGWARSIERHADLLTLTAPAGREASVQATLDWLIHEAMRRAFEEPAPDQKTIEATRKRAESWGVELNGAVLEPAARRCALQALERLADGPWDATSLRLTTRMIDGLRKLPFTVDLGLAQDRFESLRTSWEPPEGTESEVTRLARSLGFATSDGDGS